MNDAIASLHNTELPTPTSDIEEGKRNLDRFGYTIHENLLNQNELVALRERLLEQAELECEEGVATYRLVDNDSISARILGQPPGGVTPAWQALLALPNKGREFIDLAMHPVVAEYDRHVLSGVPYYMAQSTGLIVRKGSGGQVLHTDQISVPFQTPVPVYFHAMVTLSDFEEGMGATELIPGSHLMRAPVSRSTKQPARLNHWRKFKRFRRFARPVPPSFSKAAFGTVRGALPRIKPGFQSSMATACTSSELRTTMPRRSMTTSTPV